MGSDPGSSLPRSEWTPCRQSVALRRKSVGTSAAPPALRASAARGDIRMESAPRPVRQSAALRGKAVGTSAARLCQGLGTFTWGFLRHSRASVLPLWGGRGKNRRDARIVSVLCPCYDHVASTRGPKVRHPLASPRGIWYNTHQLLTNAVLSQGGESSGGIERYRR